MLSSSDFDLEVLMNDFPDLHADSSLSRKSTVIIPWYLVGPFILDLVLVFADSNKLQIVIFEIIRSEIDHFLV